MKKKILIILLVLGLATPVAAIEMTPYGDFRSYLGYFNTDDYTGYPLNVEPTIGADDDGFFIDQSRTSNFGLRFHIDKNFLAGVEIGLDNNANNAWLRLAYARWQFDKGSLIVGKYYTLPCTHVGHSTTQLADLGDTGFGCLTTTGIPDVGRQYQLNLAYGNFNILAFEHAHMDGSRSGANDANFYLPRIAMTYNFQMDKIAIRPVAAFQTYEVEDTNTGFKEDIDSYLLGLGIKTNFNPIYLNVSASYLQNAGNYGDFSILISPDVWYAARVGDSIENQNAFMGSLVLGFHVNDKLTLETGFGITNAEVDTGVAETTEQTGTFYQVGARYDLGKYVDINPEIGIVDRGDIKVTGQDDADQGKMAYFNTTIRIRF